MIRQGLLSLRNLQVLISNQMLTFLLVGGPPVVRIGLKTIISENFKQIRIVEQQSTSELFAGSNLPDPDLLVLLKPGSIQNLNDETTELLKRARKSIVLFTNMPYNYALATYLRLGASGFIVLGYSEEMIVCCFKMVLDGEFFVMQDMFESLIPELSKRSGTTEVTRKSLTSREYEIATHLATGLRTSEIAAILERKSSTISTIKNTIFRKLEVENVIQLRTAMEL
jgi:DNA-binding NarL/FixJ family response regulator